MALYPVIIKSSDDGHIKEITCPDLDYEETLSSPILFSNANAFCQERLSEHAQRLIAGDYVIHDPRMPDHIMTTDTLLMVNINFVRPQAFFEKRTPILVYLAFVAMGLQSIGYSLLISSMVPGGPASSISSSILVCLTIIFEIYAVGTFTHVGYAGKIIDDKFRKNLDAGIFNKYSADTVARQLPCIAKLLALLVFMIEITSSILFALVNYTAIKAIGKSLPPTELRPGVSQWITEDIVAGYAAYFALVVSVNMLVLGMNTAYTCKEKIYNYYSNTKKLWSSGGLLAANTRHLALDDDNLRPTELKP